MDLAERYPSLRFAWPRPGVLEISFQGEKLNAMDPPLHRALSQVWRDLEALPHLRAVLLRGEGGVFSAGGSFALIEEMRASRKALMRVLEEARDLVLGPLNFPRPVVAAVEKVAVGAGLALALSADIAVVGKKARLLDGHLRLGVAAGDHAVLLWPLLVGLAKAKYHLFLHEPLTGEEAERLGLVALAVEDEAVYGRALEVAERLAKGPKEALGHTKRALNHWLRTFLPHFELSLALEFLGFSGEELEEGLRALKEKREPQFP
ncbi:MULTISPECIES: enoyl-CoA hydratase/isomerase family protein [Thermus]|jgi:enoyl-CoA hydratase|uniref:Enoyl-CoA hydratase n=1 Tax=Thermus brockianus TaxID=56956 RepID=A0A1J0LTW5_THEBO|nr:enoyl-CoA hydratase/isomerase family protein [Thermus brockianus]APD09554.1 enoyl-CoA hydratase [Thermus brockianus]